MEMWDWEERWVWIVEPDEEAEEVKHWVYDHDRPGHWVGKYKEEFKEEWKEKKKWWSRSWSKSKEISKTVESRSPV